MKILITGGTGRVGTPITEKFVANGWEVRVIGAEETCAIEGITYTHLDILDFDAVLEQVDGVDAIIHLAAIPSTLPLPAPDVFQINVAGTHNVYEAASRVGVKRVVQASSINAIGSYWGYDDRKFEYFPLDENHNKHTTDVYSLSKQLVEDVAAYFWRRDGISGASFRLPAVWTSHDIEERKISKRMVEKREQLEAFAKLPEEEQKRQIAEVHQRVVEFRAGRYFAYEARADGSAEGKGDFDNWLWNSYFFDRYNYWSFIHTDDSTQAFEKAIVAEYDGSHPLFANANKNYLNMDSEMLLGLFFPDVTKRSKPIHGAETLISNDRAHDLIGYKPVVNEV